MLLYEIEVAATCYGMNKCSSGCMATAYKRLICMLPGDLISPRGLACSKVSAKSILPRLFVTLGRALWAWRWALVIQLCGRII